MNTPLFYPGESILHALRESRLHTIQPGWTEPKMTKYFDPTYFEDVGNISMAWVSSESKLAIWGSTDLVLDGSTVLSSNLIDLVDFSQTPPVVSSHIHGADDTATLSGLLYDEPTDKLVCVRATPWMATTTGNRAILAPHCGRARPISLASDLRPAA